MGHGSFGDGFTSIIGAGGGSGGSGDGNASYVVLSTTASLSNERVLTAGTGINIADGGAGGNVTLSINNGVVATVSGTTFTGTVSGTTANFTTVNATTLSGSTGIFTTTSGTIANFTTVNATTLSGTTAKFAQFGDGSLALTLSGTSVTYASGGLNVVSITSDTSSDLILSAAFSTSGIQFKNTNTQIPSTTGLIRLPNNVSINARNNANSANITIINTDASNNVNIGDSTNTANNNTIAATSITSQIGANPQLSITAGQVKIQNTTAPANLVFSGTTSSPATTGLIRLPNNIGINGRNAANTADVMLIGLDSINTVNVGNVNAGRVALQSNSAGLLLFYIDVNPQLSIAAGQVQIQNTTAPANLIFSGTTSSPATTGLIRLPNTITIAGRNASNTADSTLLTTVGDVLNIGDAATNAFVVNRALSGLNLQVGANTQVAISAGQVQIQNTTAPANLVFSGTTSSPATTGLIRLPNATSVAYRNAANTTDFTLISSRVDNDILLSTTGTFHHSCSYTKLYNQNAGAIPAGMVANGGLLYIHDGALFYIGSGSTITKLANA